MGLKTLAIRRLVDDPLDLEDPPPRLLPASATSPNSNSETRSRSSSGNLDGDDMPAEGKDKFWGSFLMD